MCSDSLRQVVEWSKGSVVPLIYRLEGHSHTILKILLFSSQGHREFHIVELKKSLLELLEVGSGRSNTFA